MPVRGRNAGNRGQGSKWLSKKKRAAIYARDLHRCVWCGCSEDLTVDHLIPRSRGGSNDANNLVTACMPCNRVRGDRPLAEFATDVLATPVLRRLLRALDGAVEIPGFQRRRPKLRAVA